ncbi:MAG: hypothetical protein KJ006_10020, partial [Thermoleophilia bacterium]|nr:hypothetical protein [Thermoleophilia bacterium]
MEPSRAPSRGWRPLVTLLVAVAVALLAGPATGAAAKRGLPKGKAYLPGKGKIFAGTSDTGQTSDFREYRR